MRACCVCVPQQEKEDELARDRAEFESEQRRKAAEVERQLAEQRLRAEKLKARQALEERQKQCVCSLYLCQCVVLRVSVHVLVLCVRQQVSACPSVCS